MHIASMSLGIFDFLIDWIAQLVGNIIGWVFDIIMGIVNRMIFTIAKQILVIVDIIQMLFRRLAGLDKYYVNTGSGMNEAHEGDILISLMSNETVLEVLLTLTLVAVAMVIIATIIKVVQSEFTTEGSKNSKGSIIGQAIKSLVMFILVPVLCFGGVFLSNALLKAMDAATSQGSESSMASQIFVSAASSANKIRFGQGTLSNNEDYLKKHGLWVEGNAAQTAVNVDNAFRMQSDLGDVPVSLGGIVETVINTVFGYAAGGGAFVIIGVANSFSPGIASYQNIYMVGSFYDIGQMNMIILIGGSIMACYVMLVTSFGLVMRLFKSVILFMISPPVIAIAPLDKGNAFGSWRKQFVSEVLAGYGAILGLNLFFIVLPVLNNIDLFPALYGGTMGGSIYNDIAHLLFTLVGLYMLKDLIKMVGDIAGGSDAMGAGEGMAKKAGATALKVGVAAAGVATGGAALAAGKIAGLAGNTGLANKLTSFGKAGMKSAGNQAHFGIQKLKGKANEFLGTNLNAETDPTKELEKQKELDDAREERAKSGRTTMGDMVGNAGRAIGSKIKGSTNDLRHSTLDELGEATGFESDAKAITRYKKKEASDSLKNGMQSAGTSVGDAAAISTAQTDMNAGFTVDENKIGEAMAKAMQHANNASEGEQSQQIWRAILEQLKNINDMKIGGADSTTVKNAITQLNTSMSTTGDYGKQIEVAKIQAAMHTHLTNHFTTGAAKNAVIDVDAIKAEIARTSTLTGKDLEKLQEQVVAKIKAEVEKNAPK